MPSTHLSLHYHIVFGTKNHEAVIHQRWRLHAYLGGIITTMQGVPEQIGGVADHVHLLMGLRSTHCLADVLRELKSVSSGWIHDETKTKSFAWQEGYGAFTVSNSERGAVRNYIANQEEHHRTQTISRRIFSLAQTARGRIRRTLCLLIHRPCRGETALCIPTGGSRHRLTSIIPSGFRE